MVVTDSISRRNRVLQVVVDTYVRTAIPVSSGFACQKSGLGLSPATIRNIMADLEGEGYLTHPHTSAGRLPTDKGYRLYVNELMDVEDLSAQEKAAIEVELADIMKSLRDYALPLSKYLSNLTHQLAFVFDEDGLHYVGIPNILEQPEFKDVDHSRALLRALEEEKDIADMLLDDLQRDEVCIHIGSEIEYRELWRCSIVVSTYKVSGKPAGVGVVGPTRMAYANVVRPVKYLANLTGRLLL